MKRVFPRSFVHLFRYRKDKQLKLIFSVPLICMSA